MTHVCVLTFSHDPYDGRLYHREAKSLARHGYIVTILSLHDGEKQDILDKNIAVKYLKVSHRNIFILFFFKLYVLFREALRVNADIYHCHEPESHLIGLAIKIFKRKKIVLDVHEYYRDLIKNTGRFYGYFYAFTCYIIEPLFCCLDDYIICADNEIRKLYIRFNKNVLTLFNYPITNYWETHDNQIKNIKTTKHTLIYTGDISEVRGLWSMLAVVEELIKVFFDVRLLLIGEITSSELKEKIDHYIKSRNLEDAVVFLGHIPHQDVASYMKLASIGLLLYEPLKKFLKNIPTKQYEYAASGLALVASDLPPTRNFILPNKCGILVTPGNVAEAVDAITYLFKHTIELEMLGNNGKKIILDKYNWHNQESELLNIYKTMTH